MVSDRWSLIRSAQSQSGPHHPGSGTRARSRVRRWCALLAHAQCGADPGRAVEASNARARGPHPLGAVALGHDLELDLAGMVERSSNT